ncbi:MAG: [NiFe]-hydrogenase assembly chaperone HybE [Acetobacter sp.]|nr:[NiFe]-hydrogenase assembly chaperone HybE [Acetobacter sp.]MBO6036330.1 [NiFe]-hydrogenase assembly chaperone HybE [Acetobacter sp.]MBO6086273.1 [NiFe]-hydrogenase assembly chaperone HybE [Acetobacter sp.]MBQ5470308.1 [NiFe]-hydrogenase assembly chaperone HybE [Acetobacter sp.]MBQ5516653.1 [NiFe]-hydrogenase assembly chaperone HybE [Acetobacter sp.]
MKTSLPRFEGSYLGDSTRLSPDAVMECKICWFVYDPTKGCDVWQIPPGTAFADLPDFWRCPVCDGPRDQFMVIHSDHADGSASSPTSEKVDEVLSKSVSQIESFSPSYPIQFGHKLEETFREIYSARMRDIPLINKALSVRAVGFRSYEGHVLGILITPWFMNIIFAPGEGEDWSELVSGTKEWVPFPSGEYEFMAVCRVEEVGIQALPPYRACSLFSPMFEFSTMEQAIETAQEVLRALLDPALNPNMQASR